MLSHKRYEQNVKFYTKFSQKFYKSTFFETKVTKFRSKYKTLNYQTKFIHNDGLSPFIPDQSCFGLGANATIAHTHGKTVALQNAADASHRQLHRGVEGAIL